jgi:MATE family multidrug resistance protein
MTATLPAPAAGIEIPVSSHSWRGEFRGLFKLAWPLILAQVGQNALVTTDVIVLGQLGAKYVAAAALANAIFICVQLLGIGILGAVAPMVAQSLGARDFRSVRRTVRQGLWLSVILFALLLPVAWNIGAILHALGQDPELIGLVDIFIRYAVWMLLPAFLFITLRSFLSAHGATGAILAITLGGVVVNIAANYALVFGHWGFPRLEMAGSGIATTLVNFFMLALTIAYVEAHRRFRRYHVFHNLLKPDWPRLGQLVVIGGPIGLMLIAEVGLFTSASLLQGWLGEAELAAHSVALTTASLAFMVPLGISQATTVRVGIALGEGNREGIRKAGWMALFVTLAFMSLTALTFFSVPDVIVGFFLNSGIAENRTPLALAASFLVIAGLFQLVDGTQVTMAAALRGLSDTNMPLLIALVGYWLVGFPVAWLLGLQLGFRGVGIWLGLAAGLAVVALVLTIRWALRERLGLTSVAPV